MTVCACTGKYIVQRTGASDELEDLEQPFHVHPLDEVRVGVAQAGEEDEHSLRLCLAHGRRAGEVVDKDFRWDWLACNEVLYSCSPHLPHT